MTPQSTIHLTPLILALTICSTAVKVGVAAPQLKVDRMLSASQLVELQGALSERVVNLTIKASPKANIRFVVPRVRTALGYLISPRLILSSAAILSLGADESELSIHAQCAHRTADERPDDSRSSRTLNSVQVKKSSLSSGWVGLQPSVPLNCRPLKTLPKRILTLSSDVGSKNTALYTGMRLYALESPPRRPSLVTIEGRSAPPMSFYWYSSARLKLGTPLFNSHGKLMTLVGALQQRQVGVHLLPYHVINEAVADLEKRTHE